MSAQVVLLGEIRQLIDAARQRAATAVNSELTLLYWRIGQRIHTQVLAGQRAEYGEEIVATLSQQLMNDYGIETAAEDSDLEEVYNTERHLLYVACTRARDQLLVTSVEPASEFLDDLKAG